MTDGPRMWLAIGDLDIGVAGGEDETLEDVETRFYDLLDEAIEVDPTLDEDDDVSNGGAY